MIKYILSSTYKQSIFVFNVCVFCFDEHLSSARVHHYLLFKKATAVSSARTVLCALCKDKRDNNDPTADLSCR